jgi:hypothetical protein
MRAAAALRPHGLYAGGADRNRSIALNHFMPEKKKAEISSVFNWFKEDFEKAG